MTGSMPDFLFDQVMAYQVVGEKFVSLVPRVSRRLSKFSMKQGMEQMPRPLAAGAFLTCEPNSPSLRSNG